MEGFSCGIFSEPRIIEYLRKKKYYMENNIAPCIPLEAEYSITSDDIRRLKKDKSLLTQDNNFFMNTQYMYKDRQFDEMTSNWQPAEVAKKPRNRMIVSSPHIEPKIQYKSRLHFETPIDCYAHEQQSSRLHHNPPPKKVQEYTSEYTEPPAFLSQIIKKHTSNRLYDDKDIDSMRQTNPNGCINTIREQFYNGGQFYPDVVASDMQSGMPVRTKKTYGFDDPFEHYYDYIDGDMQSPEHTVMDFPRGGESSRLDNKQPKQRFIV